MAEKINGLYKAEVIYGRGHDDLSEPSSSPPWSASTGSTIGDCWSQSATSLPQKPNNDTMPRWTASSWPRNVNRMASGNPGPIQSVAGRDIK